MASKIFLLAIVLAAVAISECHPKTGKRSSNYGMYNNGQSGELNIGTYLTSKSVQAEKKSIDGDSSSSESREYVPPQFNSQARQNKQQNVYNLRKNMQRNQQGQWQDSNQQQQWDLQNQGQQQHSGEYQQQNYAEYQQQGQSQGQGYGDQGSKQYQDQYQQSPEESNSQLQGHGYDQQKQYQNQQKQYQDQYSSEETAFQKSNNWQNETSWKSANPQSSEKSPQKYNFPRQAGQQQGNSDESDSSGERRLQPGNWQWNSKGQQVQDQLMYAGAYQLKQLAHHQQSNKQNDQSGLNNSQQQNSDESIDIQKANKVIVKHDNDELLHGRIIYNEQGQRIPSESSEEISSEKATSGGRTNGIYRY